MQYCLSDKVFTNLQILYLLDTWGLAALQYMLQVTSKPRSACGDEGSGGGLWWVVAGPGPGPRVAEWRSGGCRVQRTSGVIVVMTPQPCYHLVTLPATWHQLENDAIDI